MTCTPRLDVLSNNIRLLHAFEELPVVYCGFAINVGARDEHDDEHGIAHFIEHLLFKGTRRRSNLQIIKRLEDVGGELNAYTTKEETFVYATVPRKYAERAIELLADIVLDSTFPQEELVKEREVVFEEIEMYNDSPSELIFDDFEDIVFSSSSLGHNILGSKKSLSKIDSDSCHRFVHRCYTADNMLFFMFGGIPEDHFLRLANKHIGINDFRRGVSQRHTPPPSQPVSTVCRKKTNQTHCLIGNTVISMAATDSLTLTLLNNILGGSSLTSRLNLAIRERNGWVYAIDSSLNLYSDTGVWAIYFGCSESNYLKCTKLIYNELDKLICKPLSTRQLSLSKQQIYGQILINSQNKEYYILSAAKIALHLNEEASLDRTFERISLIEPVDIQNMAAKIFDTKRLSTLKYEQYSKQ